MSSNRGKFDAYKNADILTASKETILLMMYAGAIRFLKQGIAALERKEPIEKTKYVIKCQEIVAELHATLNFEIGGDLAKQLEQLYVYVTERLVQGNMENNPQPLNEALTILSSLHEAWEKAIASLRAEPQEVQK